MRRRTGLVKQLRGQILLIDSGFERVTVDCLLHDQDDFCRLVTLSFTVSVPAVGRVLGLLRRWESHDDPVDVLIADGRSGPEVEMTSGDESLVLAIAG